MPRVSSPATRRYIAPLLLALAWNALLVGAIAALTLWSNDAVPDALTMNAPVELLRASEAPPLPPEPDEPAEEDASLAYVPTLESVDARRPDDASAVAAVDQQVERETAARRATGDVASPTAERRPEASPAPPRLGEPLDVPQAALGTPSEARALPRATWREAEGGTELRREAPAAAPPGNGDTLPRRMPGVPLGTLDAPPSPSLDLRAFGTDALAAQQFVASTTVRPPDSVSVEDGDRTMLNTQRVAYWSFFERLRRALQNVWDPNRAWRASDPTFDRLERQEYVTIIDIALRTDGMMEQLEVYRSSGSEVLDREAIRALDAIVPVRNVPEGLVSADGRAYIRYYFSFDARGGGSSLRWLRRD